MNMMEFQLQGVSDPRLAVHATSALPAWLWSTDGTRVLWANPVGVELFGAANAAMLAERAFGPADGHRRQVAQLAGRLPLSGTARLERLRGFGARPGMLVTCACARLDLSDGSHGVLIAPLESSQPGMPLFQRLQRLVEGVDKPIAVFGCDGMLAAANESARALFRFGNLTEAGLDEARTTALASGRGETAIDAGHDMILQRVGSGPDIALVALIVPTGQGAAPVRVPAAEAEPSPFVEPVADEPEEPEQTATLAPDMPAPWLDHPAPEPWQHPLRFVWQMDAEARFTVTSEEFLDLIGPQTAASLGRTWRDIARRLRLDPDGRVMKAFATRDTWSGITLNWPVDGGGSLPVELAGLAVFDRTRNFIGFRGFGVCRDLDALARLASYRCDESEEPAGRRQALSADIVSTNSEHGPAPVPPAEPDVMGSETAEPGAPMANGTSTPTETPTDLEAPADTPPNVVPFRPLGGEPRSPALTPVENNAFNELARRLSAHLERDYASEPRGDDLTAPTEPPATQATEGYIEPTAGEQPEWLTPSEPPPLGESRRDRTLLDLLPTGVLIYRLDRLLYANPAFLERIGYASLHALEQAGGLDALYVEAGVPAASSASEAGTPVTISANEDAAEHASPTQARLFTISWDGDSALALMFAPGPSAPVPPPPAAPAPAPVAAGHPSAEDLAAILDTTAEGILMFDANGHIHACNRSAEALFGYDGTSLVERNLVELFAPESQPAVQDYLESTTNAAAGSVLDAGRDVLGRVSQGGIIPLSMTMGRTSPDGPNFFAVFRDQSQSRKDDGEVRDARRIAERAASAKADMLARISHEVRTPLNAIIGFAEVMMSERFGPLGNERYLEYLKDIRASGERVIAMINDLTELSRIETGKLDLAFTSQNLNELVESCVSVMQPQANRERIIIRTSLAHLLPPVVADAHSLRQITMNLIGNSIHLANPGGQVIVSTALSDHGEVVLRVRDTGHGLNDNEVAAALEPFRMPDQASDGSPVNLSLTKALVEANRAQFHIKAAGRSGTLVEVVFGRALTRV